MKLKTLKDLEQERKNTLTRQGLIEWVKSVSIKDLREEAIKWVKNGMYTEHDFKLFHNITEEDLKSENKRR